MSIVQEIGDFLKKLRPVVVVNYDIEQGIRLVFGKITPTKKKKIPKKELETIIQEEAEVTLNAGGLKRFILPFSRPNLPEGYHRDFLTGLPLHPKRYSDLLEGGLYWSLPILGYVSTRSIQERVIKLGRIPIPTCDDNPNCVLVEFGVKGNIYNYKKTYLAVLDHKESLGNYLGEILFENGLGESYKHFWANKEKVKGLRELVNKEMEKKIKSWGSKFTFYIRGIAPCKTILQVHEGTIPISDSKLYQEDDNDSDD